MWSVVQGPAVTAWQTPGLDLSPMSLSSTMKDFDLRYWPLRKTVQGFRAPPPPLKPQTTVHLCVCGGGSEVVVNFIYIFIYLFRILRQGFIL